MSESILIFDRYIAGRVSGLLKMHITHKHTKCKSHHITILPSPYLPLWSALLALSHWSLNFSHSGLHFVSETPQTCGPPQSSCTSSSPWNTQPGKLCGSLSFGFQSKNIFSVKLSLTTNIITQHYEGFSFIALSVSEITLFGYLVILSFPTLECKCKDFVFTVFPGSGM